MALVRYCDLCGDPDAHRSRLDLTWRGYSEPEKQLEFDPDLCSRCYDRVSAQVKLAFRPNSDLAKTDRNR